MGICESIFGTKTELKTKPPNNKIATQKPINNFQDDEKSDDTMDYVKVPVDQSFNSEMMKKKFEDNSTNDTNNLREKIKTKNNEQNNNLNSTTDINLTKSNVSSNYQEEMIPKNPLLNSDCNNKINQNNNDNVKTVNNGNTFINTSSRINNNSNSNIGFSNNNQNNIIKNSSKINVSLHESKMTQSAYINIPKQDQKPISVSNVFSSSLFQSQ